MELSPCDPLEEVQWDFKDDGVAPADPDGKQQHAVETLNAVDVGSSSLLRADVSKDFLAEAALESVVGFVREYGCPKRFTFDRDPGGWGV